MDGSSGEAECERLGVGSRADLGHMNEGHKFLARSEAAAIAASMCQGLMDKGRVMSAAYLGCAGIGSGHGNGEGVGLSGMSRTESMSSMVSTRVGRYKSASTVSSGGDGVWRALRY